LRRLSTLPQFPANALEAHLFDKGLNKGFGFN
jgi:hypothetical protein